MLKKGVHPILIESIVVKLGSISVIVTLTYFSVAFAFLIFGVLVLKADVIEGLVSRVVL